MLTTWSIKLVLSQSVKVYSKDKPFSLAVNQVLNEHWWDPLRLKANTCITCSPQLPDKDKGEKESNFLNTQMNLKKIGQMLSIDNMLWDSI